MGVVVRVRSIEGERGRGGGGGGGTLLTATLLASPTLSPPSSSYPTGGDNTSVTSGVVSRVEVAQYVHAASHLMAIQIDAAINPGNSGERGGGRQCVHAASHLMAIQIDAAINPGNSGERGGGARQYVHSASHLDGHSDRRRDQPRKFR